MYVYMKKCLFALATFSLLFACTPENNNNGGGGQNNQDELTVTGEVLEITDYSATLTGYANLPLELGDSAGFSECDPDLGNQYALEVETGDIHGHYVFLRFM